MSDDPYLRRAQEALNAAKKKKAVYRGECSACRYSRPGMMGLWCAHPAVTLVQFNVTDGYAKDQIVECDNQRDRDCVYGPVVCGPNGALFEPGFLARLMGMFQ